jgi:uncharacterized protein YukE
VSDIVTNYDEVTMTITPTAMNAASTSITAAVTDIADQLATIFDAFNSLQISWTGGSATLADDFNTRWTQAVTTLFGTQADPGEGVLNLIVSGIGAAAGNYSLAEQEINNWFVQFATSMSASGAGSSGAQTVSDQPSGPYHTTAVDETSG